MTHIRVKEHLFELLRRPSAPQAPQRRSAHRRRSASARPTVSSDASGGPIREARPAAQPAASLAQRRRAAGRRAGRTRGRASRGPRPAAPPASPSRPWRPRTKPRPNASSRRCSGVAAPSVAAVAVQRECAPARTRDAPARAPQPQREVDVLPVREERGHRSRRRRCHALAPVGRRAAARPGGRRASRGRRRARSSRGPRSRRSRRARRRRSRPGRDAGAGSGRRRPCRRRGPRTARASARRSPGRGRRRC